jgi:hypothetical protein
MQEKAQKERQAKIVVFPERAAAGAVARRKATDSSCSWSGPRSINMAALTDYSLEREICRFRALFYDPMNRAFNA